LNGKRKTFAPAKDIAASVEIACSVRAVGVTAFGVDSAFSRGHFILPFSVVNNLLGVLCINGLHYNFFLPRKCPFKKVVYVDPGSCTPTLNHGPNLRDTLA